MPALPRRDRTSKALIFIMPPKNTAAHNNQRSWAPGPGSTRPQLSLIQRHFLFFFPASGWVYLCSSEFTAVWASIFVYSVSARASKLEDTLAPAKLQVSWTPTVIMFSHRFLSVWIFNALSILFYYFILAGSGGGGMTLPVFDWRQLAGCTYTVA